MLFKNLLTRIKSFPTKMVYTSDNKLVPNDSIILSMTLISEDGNNLNIIMNSWDDFPLLESHPYETYIIHRLVINNATDMETFKEIMTFVFISSKYYSTHTINNLRP